MTPTANIWSDLLGEEGEVLTAYPDPLTHGAPWTIGIGHAGPDVHPGETETDAQAQTQLHQDVALVCAGIDRNMAWADALSATPRGDALIDLAFNMGLTKLLTFKDFLGYMQAGKYNHAGLDLLGTLYARESPGTRLRARRLAKQISSGVHA